LARARVRQHVNPLSNKYLTEVTVPDWEKVYQNPGQPIHLDLGCARGRFLLQMAQLQSQINFLGIEIRETLVLEANSIGEQLGLTNLHYLFANVNNSLDRILSSFPKDSLHWVTIQFPDPWFKQRHKRRRVVQPEVVDTLAKYLVPGGKVLLQSDVEDVALEMGDRFWANSSFQKQHQEPWLETNPLPVPTEREKATFAKGEPVYRLLFAKI
jgi:tRNA (guanine-N7-)-methyltransferase